MNDRGSSYCFACGGAYWTLGSSTHWVPHAEDCPKASSERARQDRAAAALREVESPMYDVFDSPWLDDEDACRRLLARAGIPAPRPKDRPELHELVEPERATTRRMLRSAKRLTPDYGDPGPTR